MRSKLGLYLLSVVGGLLIIEAVGRFIMGVGSGIGHLLSFL